MVGILGRRSIGRFVLGATCKSGGLVHGMAGIHHPTHIFSDLKGGAHVKN